MSQMRASPIKSAKSKGSENGGWIRVVSKKVKKEAKVPILFAAIVISSKRNLPHADIVRKVPADPELKDLDENIISFVPFTSGVGSS